jgi:hypothetical protein
LAAQKEQQSGNPTADSVYDKLRMFNGQAAAAVSAASVGWGKLPCYLIENNLILIGMLGYNVLKLIIRKVLERTIGCDKILMQSSSTWGIVFSVNYIINYNMCFIYVNFINLISMSFQHGIQEVILEQLGSLHPQLQLRCHPHPGMTLINEVCYNAITE